MTGSLQKKNGKYYVVLCETLDTGKQKQKWISTGLSIKGNKKNAEKILQDVLNQYDCQPQKVNMEVIVKPIPQPQQSVLETKSKSDILFHSYILKWLDRKKIGIDPITYQGYVSLSEAHIIPYFKKKKLKLSEIDRDILQEYINFKYEKGRINGKGKLSPKTVKEHKNIINMVLKEAVKDGLIEKNPCEYVLLPQNERREVDFYTEKEIKVLLEAIRDHPLFPIVYLTIIYGLRRSEVLGLKWDSFDFERNMVTIKHTVVTGAAEIVEKNKTKNNSSHRSYPLTEEVKAIVQNQKEIAEKNKKILRKGYKDNGYVFCWGDGRFYDPNYITKTWTLLLKKNGLRHIRFHDLRHSCASLLIAQGWQLKDIQEWLGHADIGTTANIYGHLDAERKNNIANAMSQTFRI